MCRPLPEIRVRIMRPNEPDAQLWWTFDTEDAAEIRAGRKFPHVVEIVDTNGRVLDRLPNLVAGPGLEGTYRTPWDIPDTAVAYYAADCWTYACGITPGTLIRLLGHHHRVLGYEHVDAGYGDLGYATGYLICQPARGGRPVRPNIQHTARQVLELTAPKCSTIGCRDWATHTLWTDPCDPLAELVKPGRRRELVCEPCGQSYMRTNHVKLLNPALTEGTV